GDRAGGEGEVGTRRGARAAYQMVGRAPPIILHPRGWKCSGHYDLFHDYMVDCRESKKRYRHDQVSGRWVEAKGRRIFVAVQSGGPGGGKEAEQRGLKIFNLRAKNAGELRWGGPLVPLTAGKDFAPRLRPHAPGPPTPP